MQSQDQVDKAVQAVSHALEILPESEEAQRTLTSLKIKPLPKPVRSGRIDPLKVAPIRSLEKASLWTAKKGWTRSQAPD
jgi:hypothetical protein